MKLQLVSEGKCFAFLAEDSGLHLDMHLNEVRARLNTEAEELMPSSYKFLFRNIPLSANQESLLTLRLCSEESNPGTELYVLNFSETETTPEKCPKTVPNNTGLDAQLKAAKSSNPEKTTEKAEKLEENREKIKSLNSSKIKVDVFTDDEILGQSCWLERERRTYWNIKANELRVSKEAENYGKTELIGVIDTAWTLKKAQLLQLRASQLQVMHERLKTVYSHEYQSVKKTSKDALAESEKIADNNERVSKTLFFIQNENRRLSSLLISKTDRAQAEERLHKYLYELKRTSDALFKALCNQEKRLNNFQQETIKPQETEWFDGEGLPVSEEYDIAVEMKQERVMDE